MSAHGRVIHKSPCESCGSRDNVAVYEDGYEKCFGQGCEYYRMPEGDKVILSAAWRAWMTKS
jgi:hypothetical protein